MRLNIIQNQRIQGRTLQNKKQVKLLVPLEIKPDKYLKRNYTGERLS
jgi:hypothetical protein